MREDLVMGTSLIEVAILNIHTIKRIKIPNVCGGLNIRFMTPYEMLRRERARFVLGGHYPPSGIVNKI